MHTVSVPWLSASTGVLDARLCRVFSSAIWRFSILWTVLLYIWSSWMLVASRCSLSSSGYIGYRKCRVVRETCYLKMQYKATCLVRRGRIIPKQPQLNFSESRLQSASAVYVPCEFVVSNWDCAASGCLVAWRSLSRRVILVVWSRSPAFDVHLWSKSNIERCGRGSAFWFVVSPIVCWRWASDCFSLRRLRPAGLSSARDVPLFRS